MSSNNVIGRDNDLPWRLPDDMRYFMRTTTGHTVVMGRRTWESMGGRALPNRRNIVVTRQPDYAATGAEVAHSVDEAIALATEAGETELFICGGARVYADAMARADRLYLTHVHVEIDGDTYFPDYHTDDWRLVSEESHAADDRNEHAFTFAVYERA